jgi:hypothetical protein
VACWICAQKKMFVFRRPIVLAYLNGFALQAAFVSVPSYLMAHRLFVTVRLSGGSEGG